MKKVIKEFIPQGGKHCITNSSNRFLHIMVIHYQKK